jgi:glycosyltransferase involved in cell wall biosynthesis
MLSDICVIIPAYNAEKTVGDVVRGALKYLPKVIVADDGSTDATANAANAAGAEVIRLSENKGKGNALKILFMRAIEEGYGSVLSMDADGQHDPDEIPKFLEDYRQHSDSIVVGTRMKEKGKIPRARYNSMHIARFYVSLVSNQFVEDTQCGYRLYPLSVIKRLRLITEKYVTETEILMKAGDSGTEIRFVPIRTIYGENGSHFRPITDVTLITAYVIAYVHIKWLIEGVSSNKPDTYTPKGHLMDLICIFKPLAAVFQAITALTALPASIFFLFEYVLLKPFMRNNFASVRMLGCGFAKITLATQMLPVTLIVAIIEQIINKFGCKVNLVDGFVLKYYPNLWKNNKTG